MVASKEQVLSTLRERIVAYAASRLGRDAAEDLAQEALVLLVTKYPQVEAMEELVPLAFQILRFKMNDFRRKAQRRGEFTAVAVDELPLADEGANPYDALERRELQERLSAALGKLEGRCREIFRLKLAGYSFAQIQSELGAASINTVYTWDFRCRKTLVELMGGSQLPSRDREGAEFRAGK
jgi:RNA polymerase sigma-70 factor (ECF subfamily)